MSDLIKVARVVEAFLSLEIVRPSAVGCGPPAAPTETLSGEVSAWLSCTKQEQSFYLDFKFTACQTLHMLTLSAIFSFTYYKKIHVFDHFYLMNFHAYKKKKS